MKAEYINPFASAAVDVFSTMIQCQLKRGELSLGKDAQPVLDISGVIGLSGRATGTVVLSVERTVAIRATEVMLGQTPDGIDADVIDAVKEITNMVAGRAKASLEHLAMTLALPTIVTGKNHVISFGSATQILRIPYACEWGQLVLEVGLVERAENAEPTRQLAAAAH